MSYVNGMCAGPIIAVAPILVVGAITGGGMITGLMASAFTDGRYNSAFNVIVMSSKFFTIMKSSFLIGSAVSAISLVGFCIKNERLPRPSDFS